MKKLGQVGKYNLYKGVSTLLTVGTPLITLACQSDFFVHNAGASISATGIFAILIAMLFLKDKIAAKLKTPSAFIVSTVLFVFILLVENILQPMKYVCLASMIACGIDEFTFKRLYTQIEALFPKATKAYTFAGFLFTTTDKFIASESTIKETSDNNEEVK